MAENGKVCKNPWSRSLDSQENPEARVSTIVLLFASVVLSHWMVAMRESDQTNEQSVTTDSLVAVVHGESIYFNYSITGGPLVLMGFFLMLE